MVRTAASLGSTGGARAEATEAASLRLAVPGPGRVPSHFAHGGFHMPEGPDSLASLHPVDADVARAPAAVGGAFACAAGAWHAQYRDSKTGDREGEE